MASGRIRRMTATEMTAPTRKVNRMSIVKMRFAFSGSPSPKVLDTSALPPAPTMRPSAATMASAGQMIFIAAKAVLPA